ncbi:hypothetical protein PC110_g15764 [Phytophthora cactorum]|uniref:Uncharacterized protein n=1 Tax=Phytophthora cactorum TaxID=29920 RepID=A0A329RSZ1_9STRA|nr:hypothetical protein PC117_g11389 [Phytophthora cactorum]RAW27834.1 hypothetical protein PC110_g15764 [Phytophthora cactorum]
MHTLTASHLDKRVLLLAFSFPASGNDAPDGDTTNRESQPGIKYLTTGHGPRGDQECEMEENIVCTPCSDVGNNVENEDQASQKLQATQSVMKALEWRTRVGSEPRTMNPGCKYQLYKVQDKTDRPKIHEDSKNIEVRSLYPVPLH